MRLPIFLLMATSAAAGSKASKAGCGADGTGIYSKDFKECCPAKCGTTCGGTGCGRVFPGSAKDCCTGPIRKAKVACGKGVSAPCVVAAPAPKCAHIDEQCGGSYRQGADVYAPLQVAPHTTCCPLFQGTTCRALPMDANGIFGTECAAYKACPAGRTACASETYAFTLFGQMVQAQCCASGEQCYADAASRHRGTRCARPLRCSGRKPAGQTPCGRKHAEIMETPDDRCCAADKRCYILDQADGGYTTACSTCATPCGRAPEDAAGSAGDNRCCLPKQECAPAFHGSQPAVTTTCLYPFSCARGTCKNKGVCKEHDFPYEGRFERCQCPRGFAGVFCEIPLRYA